MNAEQKQLLMELLNQELKKIDRQIEKCEEGKKMWQELGGDVQIQNRRLIQLAKNKTLAITTQIQIAYTIIKEN